MASRVKLNHLLLSVDFFEDDAVLEVGERFGDAGENFVLRVLALMANTTGGAVSRLAARGRRRPTMTAEVADEIIDFCVTNQLFTDEGNGKIGNVPVNKDQEKLAKARTEAIERKKKYEQERERNANGTRTPVTVSVTDTEDLNLKETVILPDSTAQDVVDAVQRWGKHLETKRKKFGQLEAEALISLYSGKVSELPRDINHSISSGFKAVYPAPESRASPPKFRDFDEERRRKNAEARARFLAGDDDDKERTSKTA